MRGEEAAAAVSVPEAGRDGEQPRPPAGLGCAVRGEPGGGGPQESRKQCEFPSSRLHGGRDVGEGKPRKANGGNRGGTS